MKKWPTKITIMGVTFKIKYLTRMGDNFGMTNSATKTISIQKKLPDEEKEATLLHECIHAILFVSGSSFMLESLDNTEQSQGNFEELLVRALEHGLAPIVKMKGLDDDGQS